MFLLVSLVFWDRVHPALTGDEPNYLVYARALALDHTFDLTHQYAIPGGVAALAPGLTTAGQAIDYLHNGALHSIHAPGLAALLAPLAALHVGVNGIRVALIVLAAFGAAQVWGLARDVFPSLPAWSVWAGWAGCVLSLPFLGYSDQLYPEMPATVLLVVATRILVRHWGHRPAAAGVSFLAGLLPWFHIRFALLDIAVVIAATCSCLAAANPGKDGESISVGHRVRAVSPGVVPAMVLATGLAVLFQHLYGSISPSAQYHHDLYNPVPSQSPLQTYQVGLGSLFSPADGAIPLGPFLLVGLAGLGLVVRRLGRWAVFALVTAGLYAFVVVPFGPFGYNLPGRYDVILVPLLALGAVAVLGRFPWTVFPAAVLAAVSAYVPITHATPSTYGELLDTGRPQVLARLAPIWPVFDAQYGYSIFVADAGSAVASGITGTSSFAIPLRPIAYHVTVTLADPVTTPVKVTLLGLSDQSTGPATVLAQRTVLTGQPQRADFDLPPRSDHIIKLQVDVSTKDGPPNLLKTVAGTVASNAPSADQPIIHRLWLGFLWPVGIAVIAILLAVLDRRRGGSQHPPTARDDRAICNPLGARPVQDSQ